MPALKKRKSRRTQADILMSTLTKIPSSKAVSINSIADRSKSTWRTSKKNADMLVKAGIFEKVRSKKRILYRKK